MPWFNDDRFSWADNGDINQWADFVERLCLFSEGDEISKDSVYDWLLDDPIKTEVDILKALNFNESFFKKPKTIEAVDSEDSDEDNDVSNDISDKINGKLITLFDFLKSREKLFGENYPFHLENNLFKLKNSLSDYHKIYFILLFSSEMRLYDGTNAHAISHMFEDLTERPFSRLIPNSSVVKFFGAGGGKIRQSDYTGNLADKISRLAMDLGVEANPAVDDPDELGPSGDAGLDWVAWVPFPDSLDHQPVYFGQCACGNDWVDKQEEASLGIWQNYIMLNQPVQPMHFIPKSYRRPNGGWLKQTKLHYNLIFIDRPRMMHLFTLEPDNDSIINKYKTLLDEAEVFTLDTGTDY